LKPDCSSSNCTRCYGCSSLLRERSTWDRHTWGIIVASGIVMGLGLLTRPIIARDSRGGTVVPVQADPEADRSCDCCLLASSRAGCGAVDDPQLHTLHEPILISTNGGENLYFGNSPYTLPFLRAAITRPLTPPDANLTNRHATSAASVSARWALDYLVHIPIRFPALWAKFVAYWSIDVFPHGEPSSNDWWRITRAR